MYIWLYHILLISASNWAPIVLTRSESLIIPGYTNSVCWTCLQINPGYYFIISIHILLVLCIFMLHDICLHDLSINLVWWLNCTRLLYTWTAIVFFLVISVIVLLKKLPTTNTKILVRLLYFLCLVQCNVKHMDLLVCFFFSPAVNKSNYY